jgi:hypothetical protein
MGTIISITKGKKTTELQQQARTALTAHYTRKGFKGDELTQTVDKVMAVQFKPRPEYPYANEEQMRKALEDMRREIELLKEA